jgi:hypothetical protein
MNSVDHREILSDANFRREAAHALGTPLGALLLQAELIEHLLRGNNVNRARTAATKMMADCEALGRFLREIFASMADAVEERGTKGDPRVCLARALTDLADETVRISYVGESPQVCVPGQALEAMMRRVAIEMTALGAEDARVSGRQEGTNLCLVLDATTSRRPTLPQRPFAGDKGLNLWTARQIALRHNGDLTLGSRQPNVLIITLPLCEAHASPYTDG